MSTLLLASVQFTFTTAVGEIPALRDVSLHIHDGEFLTVIGANGAGKSTLISVIAGAQPTRSGRLQLDGDDLAGVPEQQRARSIARGLPGLQLQHLQRADRLREPDARRDPAQPPFTAALRPAEA
jgi:ABC-type uncharacterized transport system ATPase component